MRRIFALAAVAAAFVASPATAQLPALTTNSNGQLTGATALSVGSLGNYDVSFVEGTCSGLFGGCTNANFNFNTQADATSAANALLSLIAGNSAFNANPNQTFGCGPTYVSQCQMMIPFLADTLGNVSILNAVNNSSYYAAPDTTSLSSINLSMDDYDSSSDPSRVYAIFTRSPSGVPEPASWAMMLLGFGAVGAMLRRRKRPLAQLA